MTDLIKTSALKHFKMRLLPFYARLIKNPWRKNIGFIGRADFVPSLCQNKLFYFLTWDKKQRSPYGFSLILEKGFLPFPDDSLDILIIQLQEVPLEHRETLWKECYRVLSPQGRLLVTLYNRASWYFFSPWYWQETCFGLSYSLSHYHFLLLSTHGHSFRMGESCVVINKWFIRYEKKLKEWLKPVANLYTVVAFKDPKKDHLLPSYMKLSKQLSYEKLVLV